MNSGDNKIADLITDECNINIKSLNRHLNKYKAANGKSKDMVRKLIQLDQQLALNIQKYL